MRSILLAVLIMAYGTQSFPQTAHLTLETCYDLAAAHYPILKQKDLISKAASYSIENAQKGYLPQLNLLGQATYQSDVTSVPISVPGIDIPKLPKDQYKVYVEASQTLYDGGMIRKQKELATANADFEKANVTTELYKLHERINQLYFGILLIDRQLEQIRLRKSDIQAGLDRTNGAIANGTAFKSNADVFKAELLMADQAATEQIALRKSYSDMLGLFIGKTLDGTVVFIEPAKTTSLATSVTRPELDAFELRKRTYVIQEQMIFARNQPKVSLFVQAGYGRPGLNMLKNEFAFYSLGGIRFNWPISGLYTVKGERQLIRNNQEMVDVQKETFLFNTSLSVSQENSEQTKLTELMKTDDEIIRLRTSIKNTSGAQLENGVKLPADYIRDVNSESQARQNLMFHQIQLLYSQYRLKTVVGQL